MGKEKMSMSEIKSHWMGLAQKHGRKLDATTRTETIKSLEINVFKRWIKKIGLPNMEVLEVGCGNGINCIELSKIFPEYIFYGVDYVEAMVENARMASDGLKNICFGVDDATQLDSDLLKEKVFDVVMTDRCLINLNTIELQKKALEMIVKKIKPNGYFLMLENSDVSYGMQNTFREKVGLNRRVSAQFNFFLKDEILIPYLSEELNMELIMIDNFASLHDLFLYVINPLYNGGNVEYNDEIVRKITDFLLELDDYGINQFGEFGQNRLYILKKCVGDK